MNKALTKYPFQKGTQCHKAIWLHYFTPELKTPVSMEQQAIMDKGTEVGILARELFAGGLDVSQNDTLYGRQLFEATQRALNSDEQILYEAAFETLDQKMNVRADIFVRCDKNTKLIEVKSSTSLKAPEHILDLAFQYYVLKNSSYSGPTIEVYIAYLNKEYVRGEVLDVDDLFVLENVTRRIIDAQVLVKDYLRQFTQVLAMDSKCPNIKVSEACFKPYPCAFYDYCWKDMPALTVFNISRLRKSRASQLIEEGIVEPHQLPKDTKLSIEQWVEIEAAKSGKPSVNRKEIKSFLSSLELDKTTYWMDFETFMPPIPEFPGTRPYQQICFQYCVVLRKPNGNMERREFLSERNRDPRKSFIEHLLKDTKGEGCIVVY